MPLEGFLCHVTPKFRKKDEFLFLRCKSFAKSVQIFEATDGRITFHHIVFLKQNGLNLTHNLNNKRVGLVSSITRFPSLYEQTFRNVMRMFARYFYTNILALLF